MNHREKIHSLDLRHARCQSSCDHKDISELVRIAREVLQAGEELDGVKVDIDLDVLFSICKK